MSRLYKENNFSLIKKYYVFFGLLCLFGFYKNGIVPLIHHMIPFWKMLVILIYPLLSFGIGWLFDHFFKTKEIFNYTFYSVLYVLLIPPSINFFLYFGVLICFLFVHFLLQKKWEDNVLNEIVVGHLLLILLFSLFQNYTYQNILEESGLFHYSFLEYLLGHHEGGMFSTNILLIFCSLLVLCFDDYYKKEIPLYSYGIYVVFVFIYAIVKEDMSFILLHLFSSSILFALVFVAPLSIFSPYTPKGKWLYSVTIGLMILPISLMTNFHEGIYITLLFVNLAYVGINFLAKKRKKITNL